MVPVCFLMLMSLSCLFRYICWQNDMQLQMLQVVQRYPYQKEMAATAEVLVDGGACLRWKDSSMGRMCYIEKSVDIPFLGSRFWHLNHYQQMLVDDYSGICMKSENQGGEYVYITPNGSVYHIDRDCTYLRPNIKRAAVYEVEQFRNRSGGKYYPCEDCCEGKALGVSEKVYYAGYGTRYHSRSSCSKLKRTVRRVHVSSIGNLPRCSKCG